MNLIDFHVTEVLSEPVKVERDWGTYWKVLVKYWDDGGETEDWLTQPTEEGIRNIKPGYVGQH